MRGECGIWGPRSCPQRGGSGGLLTCGAQRPWFQGADHAKDATVSVHPAAVCTLQRGSASGSQLIAPGELLQGPGLQLQPLEILA